MTKTKANAEPAALKFEAVEFIVVSGEPDFLAALKSAPFIKQLLIAALARGNCSCSPTLETGTDNGQPVLEIYCDGAVLTDTARKEVAAWHKAAVAWYGENFTKKNITFSQARVAPTANQTAQWAVCKAEVLREQTLFLNQRMA
ncbi:hypothetical protein K2Q16_02040 [Patescibacteria group bacterium]|nr:hypothetical protein [Patescibacteria group bacterium]